MQSEKVARYSQNQSKPLNETNSMSCSIRCISFIDETKWNRKETDATHPWGRRRNNVKS